MRLSADSSISELTPDIPQLHRKSRRTSRAINYPHLHDIYLSTHTPHLTILPQARGNKVYLCSPLYPNHLDRAKSRIAEHNQMDQSESRGIEVHTKPSINQTKVAIESQYICKSSLVITSHRMILMSDISVSLMTEQSYHQKENYIISEQ